MDLELFFKLSIALFIIFVYFVPSYIAYFLKHHYMKNIFLLNLIHFMLVMVGVPFWVVPLLGWTGIVWVILTVYAIFSKPKKRHIY